MLKIVLIINDLIEKAKVKSYLNKLNSSQEQFEFQLVAEFNDSSEAINFLYQNREIDILIIENSLKGIYSGIDFALLAEKEFPYSSIILISEENDNLNLSEYQLNNLNSVLTKLSNSDSFINSLRMTAIKQKQKLKNMAENRKILEDYQKIIDYNNDAIFLLELDDSNNFYYTRMNQSCLDLTGFKNRELEKYKTDDIFSSEIAEELKENINRCVREKQKVNFKSSLVFSSSQRIWDINLYPILKNDIVKEVVGSLTDISEIERKKKKLKYCLEHDILTGLYNKDYFIDKLKNLEIKEEAVYSFLFINIDSFNLYKNFYGFEKADELLKKSAEIINKIFKANSLKAQIDNALFAVLLENRSKNELISAAEAIKKEFSKLKLNNIKFDISVLIKSSNSEQKTLLDIFKISIDELKSIEYNLRDSQKSLFYKSHCDFIEKNNYNNLHHSSNLLELSKKTVLEFNLNEEASRKFMLLAKLHDIGKLTIDKNILKKGASLNKSEWKRYLSHVDKSAIFAASYYDLAEIYDLIYHHHEHFDGSGYPAALKEKEIPFLNRLFTLLNFYDNLKNNLYYPFKEDKYYFAALTDQEIAAEIDKYKGKVFDPKLSDKFIKKLIIGDK
ncbi:diguanylate cyclase [Halanaerobium sp. Z-7514]|uniref:Diguanylate cyclase n=1 Tax=Halanaerobium polyolivorans TaxID=2886943 RepID=A0AAW4X2B8_9FIRM|nr:diguanylate cyclase [Halanaerobium polyolivorans]